MAQVVAGALAAVTSMLLSSQIGITGSVIGVAVGSVVSTVSAQLYKKFVQKGVDKVKDIATSDTVGPNGTVLMRRVEDRGIGADSAGGASSPAAETSAELTDPRLRFSDSHDAQVMREATDAERAETGTTIVMPRLEDRRAQRHAARMKRNVIIVSVVASIVAVAASAFVVNVVTAGNGIGYKTQPIIVVQHEEPAADDASTSAAGTQGDAADGMNADGAAASGNDAAENGTGVPAVQSPADDGDGNGAGVPGSSGEDGNPAGGDGSASGTTGDGGAQKPSDPSAGADTGSDQGAAPGSSAATQDKSS